MSTTVEPVTEQDSEINESTLPDARVLEDKTPDWMRMSASSVWFALVLGMLLITVFASRPLWHTDLWDHVNYGNWIMRAGETPASEPLLPLADGVRMVSSAWLAQVGMASLYNSTGFAGLQFVYGLLIVISLGIVTWGGVRRSESVLFGFVALGSFLALNWHQMLVIRPQLAGVLFYSGLVTWLLVVRRWYTANWWILPSIFIIWANSHGSFVIGLTVLALAAVGHSLEVLARTHSLSNALASRRFIRLFLLTQLCAVTSLLNPNGLEAFFEVLRVGRHPNIASMFEWDALTLRMQQGQIAAGLGLLLMIAVRWSPRRMRADETLMLIFFAGMTLWSARMINWVAPVLALTLSAHGAAAWRHLRGSVRSSVAAPRSGLWTLVNLGLCWLFFALTNLGVQVVHGRAVPVERAVSSRTPVSAAAFLTAEESLPEGLAFCPADWSGFLMKFGPSELRPMVNLHVHVIPEEIWSHYQQLSDGSGDWTALTDLYRINLMVTSKRRHGRLIRQVRRNDDWEMLFEDVQSVIFRRRMLVHELPASTTPEE